MANHVKYCIHNPNRSAYIKAPQLNTQESRAKAIRGIKDAHAKGAYKNAPQKAIETKTARGTLKHTQETIEKLRNSARNSTHQRRMRKTHDFVDKNGRIFRFDSSWEDALARRLDDLCIRWNRPNPIPYQDAEGVTRRYFPDFYLPDYDVYIDPKNPYVQRLQEYKIKTVSEDITLIILSSIKECLNFNIQDYVTQDALPDYPDSNRERKLRRIV